MQNSRIENSSFNQVAEISLSYKSHFNPNHRPQILSSADSYDILINNWGDQIELREEFKIILLSQNARVLGIVPISTGGVSSVLVDPKLVFASALTACSSSIIYKAHNHPSGELKPSEGDMDVTDRLIQVGRIVKTKVLDHLIISEKSYLSFDDVGYMETLKYSTKYVPGYERTKEIKKEAAENARQKQKIEIAKEFKRNGVDDQTISDSTGLSLENVQKLKVRMKK